jgi:hypothetical protein
MPVSSGVRCAGLRQALLHHWQDDFPLQDSPFQVLARETGSTVREVLGHCRALHDSGALDCLRLRWSRSMHRVSWRCGLHSGGPPGPALQARLRALPGVVGWDWVEPDDDPRPGGAPAPMAGEPAPDLWFDLVARDEAAAAAQLAWLEERAGGALRLERPDESHRQGRAGCRCADAQGPCADVELARRCEQGLPLAAHPYRALAVDAHRSERDVLAALRRWRRLGQVGRVGLAPPLAEVESRWTFAALTDGDGDGALCRRLQTRPGVVEVIRLPGHARWPYRLLVGARGSSAATRELLRRALAASLTGRCMPRMLRIRRTIVRAEPLLFAEIAAARA